MDSYNYFADSELDKEFLAFVNSHDWSNGDAILIGRSILIAGIVYHSTVEVLDMAGY